MTRLLARLAGSALLALPAASHAGDARPGTTPAGPPATRDAATAPVADPDFLEYLGSWDGSDEDWVVLGATGRGTRSKAAPATRDEASVAPVDAGKSKPAANANVDPAGNGEEQDK